MGGGPLFGAGGGSPLPLLGPLNPPPRWPTLLGGVPAGSPLADVGTLAKILGVPAKRKVFISYHHGDQAYKNELSQLYCDDYELLEDNSLERLLDSDDLKYVEREIREEYIQGASVTIVLCGAATWPRKFVDWEIYATLLKRSGLVGIRLPTLRPSVLGGSVLVPARFHDNVVTGYAVWKTWTDMLATPGILRTWIEEALTRDKARIDNSRPKMRRNGEVREHP